MINFYKVLTIISIVVDWSKKALTDNRITVKEAIDLVEKIAPVLGVPLDLDVSSITDNKPGSDMREVR